MINGCGQVADDFLIDCFDVCVYVDGCDVVVNNEFAACIGFHQTVIVGVGCAGDGDVYAGSQFCSMFIGGFDSVEIVARREIVVDHVECDVIIAGAVSRADQNDVTAHIDGNAGVGVPVVDKFKSFHGLVDGHTIGLRCAHSVVGESCLDFDGSLVALRCNLQRFAVVDDLDVKLIVFVNRPCDSCGFAFVSKLCFQIEVVNDRCLVLGEHVAVHKIVNVKCFDSYGVGFARFFDGYCQIDVNQARFGKGDFCKPIGFAFFQLDCGAFGFPFRRFTADCCGKSEIIGNGCAVHVENVTVKHVGVVLVVASSQRDAAQYHNYSQDRYDISFHLHFSFNIIILRLYPIYSE